MILSSSAFDVLAVTLSSTNQNTSNTEDQKILINVAVFDFESIFVATDELKTTKETTRIRKHVPKPSQYLQNFKMILSFLCEKDPEHLITAFDDNLELLAENKNKLQKEIKFQEIKNTVKDRVLIIFNKLKCQNFN